MSKYTKDDIENDLNGRFAEDLKKRLNAFKCRCSSNGMLPVFRAGYWLVFKLVEKEAIDKEIDLILGMLDETISKSKNDNPYDDAIHVLEEWERCRNKIVCFVDK